VHRRGILIAGLSLVLAACASTPPPPPPPDPATQMSALESRINTLIEEQRLKLNPDAAPLALDSELVGIARKRSADMAARNSFANDDTHVSATMMMDEDTTFQGLLGENVAAQHYTKQSGVDVDAFAKRFVDTWLASDSHRTNLMLKNYNRTGVGAAVNGDTVYVTQLFATDLGLGPYKGGAADKKITEFQDTAKALAPDPKHPSFRGSQ
jgi:uncharacterized protein YkwD